MWAAAQLAPPFESACSAPPRRPQRRPATDYEKQDKIGEGTFGTVHRAVVVATGKVVAIKKLKKTQGTDVATLREIMLLQELRHPNVVELVEVYVHKAQISLVFEFCATDLEAVIKDRTKVLDNTTIRSYLRGTLCGLAHCHANWILHRDMKPGNVLLDSAGEVKLADFGLARFCGSPERKFTGQVVTRWYRAPELLFGAKFYGPSVDLWSVGCILAELLQRVPFFPGTSDIDQLSKVFSTLGTPNTSDWPNVSSLPDYVAFEPTVGTPLSSIFGAAGPDAVSLLQALLTFCPAKRITAEDALQHPFCSGS